LVGNNVFGLPAGASAVAAPNAIGVSAVQL
jgi:hypothetical protein